MSLRIDIITAFPAFTDTMATYSIVGRAVKKGLAEIVSHDLRDYTKDNHRTIDAAPYGGGGGMLLKPEPLFACIEDLLGLPVMDHSKHIRDFVNTDTEVIMTSPQGVPFDQKMAVSWSLKKRLVFICGHYKGIDERVREKLTTQSVSVGDYVCTGGELPAMIMSDAVIRLIPGAMGDALSALSDSFQEDLLDCEYYTRPEDFRGMHVPAELLSGNHLEIQRWRDAQKIEWTKKMRPDLLK